MKKIFALFLTCLTVTAGVAQNVGIGTRTSNASAALESKASNKGIPLGAGLRCLRPVLHITYLI